MEGMAAGDIPSTAQIVEILLPYLACNRAIRAVFYLLCSQEAVKTGGDCVSAGIACQAKIKTLVLNFVRAF